VSTAGGDIGAFDSALADPFSAEIADWARRELLGLDASGNPQQPLWLQHWGTIATWAGYLQEGDYENIDLADAAINDDDRPMALAFVLDAAWLARVGTEEDEDAPPLAEDVIAKGAIAKMLEVVRPHARPPTGAGRASPNRGPNR
jgi:hypothetical protein